MRKKRHVLTLTLALTRTLALSLTQVRKKRYVRMGMDEKRNAKQARTKGAGGSGEATSLFLGVLSRDRETFAPMHVL